jgi:ATP-dependent RNA helicase DBP3
MEDDEVARKAARKERKRLAAEAAAAAAGAQSAAAPEAEEAAAAEEEETEEERAARKARKAAKRAAKAAAAAAAAQEEEGGAGSAAAEAGGGGGSRGQKRARVEEGSGGAGGSSSGSSSAHGEGGTAAVPKVFYRPSSTLPRDGGAAAAAYRAAKKIIEVVDTRVKLVEAGGGGGSAAPPDAFAPLTSWEHLGDNFTPAQLAITAGFKEPSPIQAQSWPIALSGRDMIGIAQTGSGKTIAFLLPALVHIAAQAPLRGGRDGGCGPIVLVLSPTRELAMQTAAVADKAGAACGLRSICIYGGVPKGPQLAALAGKGGGTHICVATPGRLRDLLEDASTGVSLARVTFVVLDEADRMLDEGFEREVRSILATIPAPVGGTRQTLMFSATWPEAVRGIAATFMSQPVKVVIGSADLTASHSVTQQVEVIEPHRRDARLLQLLQTYHGERGRTNRVIVFVLYKKEADRVAYALERAGWKNGAIHGDLSQDKRTAAFNAFKAGTVPILVATDVAARGLDIPNVECVINYSFPLTIEVRVWGVPRRQAPLPTLASTLPSARPAPSHPPPPRSLTLPPAAPAAGLHPPHWAHGARRQDGPVAHLLHHRGQGARGGAGECAPGGWRARARGPRQAL